MLGSLSVSGCLGWFTSLGLDVKGSSVHSGSQLWVQEGAEPCELGVSAGDRVRSGQCLCPWGLGGSRGDPEGPWGRTEVVGGAKDHDREAPASRGSSAKACGGQQLPPPHHSVHPELALAGRELFWARPESAACSQVI